MQVGATTLMAAAGCSTDCVRHAAASGAIGPTVAFLICGATNGLQSFDGFLAHVVRPYGPGPKSALFALLKPVDFDGSWYDSHKRRTLAQWLRQHGFMNGSQVVLDEDVPFLRHREQASSIVQCIWPDLDAAADLRQKRGVSGRVAYWWGALAMAWDLVAD